MGAFTTATTSMAPRNGTPLRTSLHRRRVVLRLPTLQQCQPTRARRSPIKARRSTRNPLTPETRMRPKKPRRNFMRNEITSSAAGATSARATLSASESKFVSTVVSPIVENCCCPASAVAGKFDPGPFCPDLIMWGRVTNNRSRPAAGGARNFCILLPRRVWWGDLISIENNLPLAIK